MSSTAAIGAAPVGLHSSSAASRTRRHVLVVSPTPSHPQNQGNSTRIHSLCKAMQQLGAAVHFVYVPLEGIDDARRRAMRQAWDTFHVAELVRANTYSSALGHLVDDWYQPSVDALLDRLFSRWSFDALLVNYVWFSRALLRAPAGCTRMVDTHDVFGARAERLAADGMTPSFFFTTPAEEGKGLDRADVVLAIQSQEAIVLAGRTRRPVEVVGHLVPANFLPPRRRTGRLRVGYIASGNPLNRFALGELCRALACRAELSEHYEFVLAGPICDAEVEGADRFEKLGYVAAAEDFYRQIDIVINPNVGGTGLKIKSVEALSFGRPLIATADALVGIETTAREHLCPDAAGMVDLLAGQPPLDAMAEASKSTFLAYRSRQLATLTRLFGHDAPRGVHA